MKMTPEQAQLFCSVAQTGIACGLEHRYEWINNYLRMLTHGSWDELLKATNDVYEAAIAFEQGTCSCPEEEDELASLDADGLVDKINAWYARG